MSKPKPKTGRLPLERLPASAEAIVKAVESGATIEQAVKAAGVSYRTYQRYRTRWPEFKRRMDAAYAKRQAARYAETMAEVQAIRQSRLTGEPQAQQPPPEANKELSPTESTDRFGKVWRIPSVCAGGLIEGKPLSPGEIRWLNLQVNDLNTYQGSCTPEHEETYVPFGGGKSIK